MSTARIGSLWLLPAIAEIGRVRSAEIEAGVEITSDLASLTVPASWEWFEAPLFGGVFAASVVCGTGRRGSPRLPDDFDQYGARLGPVPSFLARVGHCGRQIGALLAGRDHWELWRLARVGASIPAGQERLELSRTFPGAGLRSTGRTRWRRMGESGGSGPIALSCRKHDLAPITDTEWNRFAHQINAAAGGVVVIDASG